MIEFWFEFASTYSYPAAMRIEEIARREGVPVTFRAFLLGPIFRRQGWDDSPFKLYPAKGRYMWRDLERLCERYAIPFRRPSRFPRNGLLAARVATAAEGEPWAPEFVRAVFRANFADDLDISDREVIGARLEALGEPANRWLEAALTDESKAKLRARTTEAERLGIFGAPTCVVGTELFWGNDRIEEAFAWHRSGEPGGRGRASVHRAKADE